MCLVMPQSDERIKVLVCFENDVDIKHFANWNGKLKLVCEQVWL